MFQNHDRWLADEALLSIVVSKRIGKDVLDFIKKDLDKWASRYGYGNVLSTLSTPDNPRMHTATFYLKRYVWACELYHANSFSFCMSKENWSPIL